MRSLIATFLMMVGAAGVSAQCPQGTCQVQQAGFFYQVRPTVVYYQPVQYYYVSPPTTCYQSRQPIQFYRSAQPAYVIQAGCSNGSCNRR